MSQFQMFFRQNYLFLWVLLSLAVSQGKVAITYEIMFVWGGL